MANIDSENMTIRSARLKMAMLGMSRLGAAPTQANRVDSDKTIKNHRAIATDGAPATTANSWTNERS